MNSKTINILLWIAQVLLGGLFIMVGLTKSFQPIEEIAKMIPWVSNSPAAMVRFIGISELLGGIGLLLPSLLRIQPRLTSLAALGLTIIMGLATIFHIYRGEYEAIGMTIVIGLIAYFIFWGRSQKAPIPAK